jgi:predicted phosphoribosyltransferase
VGAGASAVADKLQADIGDRVSPGAGDAGPALVTWFRDRRDAGARLAQALIRYAGLADLAVLALPRGGVPVGYEVATRLAAPLDVIVVRKLGVPGYEELAMGAIEAARQRGAARVVCAVPVGPPHSCALLAKRTDDLVCLDRRHPLRAVGEAYEDFAATTDAEVRDLLDRAQREVPWSSASTSHPQA